MLDQNKLSESERTFIRAHESYLASERKRKGDNIAGVLDVIALAMVVGAIVAIMLHIVWS